MYSSTHYALSMVAMVNLTVPPGPFPVSQEMAFIISATSIPEYQDL